MCCQNALPGLHNHVAYALTRLADAEFGSPVRSYSNHFLVILTQHAPTLVHPAAAGVCAKDFGEVELERNT